MRVFVVAAALLALLPSLMPWPSQAQMSGRRQPNDGPKAEKKPEIDEKAYKAALDRIPESREKYDPWGGARPTDPPKKPK